MNKKAIALTEEEYYTSIDLLSTGFTLDKVRIRPNMRVATVCTIMAVLGLRLGDTLKLRVSSFVRDGERWRLDIVEQKTGKNRTFTVANDVYNFIKDYAYEMGIGKDAKLFDISERQVEYHIKKVFKYMKLDVRRYSPYSYRKFFATQTYINSNFNLVLVQELLQHSSPNTTRRYIGISSKDIETALADRARLLTKREVLR